MDEVTPSLQRNLDTQARRLAEVESQLAALLRGEDSEYEAPDSSGLGSYEAVTETNDLLRFENCWTEIELENSLTPKAAAQLETWREHQRIPWGKDDLAVVGLAGLLGGLACFFDNQVDTAVREGMGWIKGTDTLQGWEKDARGMPIDYTGPNFGGPGHRMRSAGHDVGRPFAALKQIRGGYFEGFTWDDGVSTVFRTAAGHYEPVSALWSALVLWTKHLLADVVTPMSLPLPGFTRLYELPNRDLRKFAHELYNGPDWGDGYNLRSGVISPMLSVLLVDVLVRIQCHWKAYKTRGTFSLSPQERVKRNEMLLAAQGVVATASIGVSAFYVHFEGPLAVRHINVPALVRTGFAALRVLSDWRTREAASLPTWSELAAQSAPWELDWVKVLQAEALSRSHFGGSLQQT